MAINSIETASAYTSELDKMLVQKSAVGFMTDNVLRTKFVGAQTVIIPDVEFVGLADYDKDKGFAKGAVTVSQTHLKLTKDRARQLQIDREDLDETGISNLAGQVLSEYVRTNVVPEMDAYVLSKLYGVADTKGNVTTYNAETAYSDLVDAINKVYAVAGYDSELVAFMDSEMYSKLMNSPEISRQIVISDFKQGNIDLQVRYLNGVAIIPVPDVRMKSDYSYLSNDDDTDTVTGGFEPAEGAKSIHAIILPKRAASLVKKTERMSIFTPEQNKDADAYVFNYRLYYDAFVKKSNLDTIFAISE
ncbi:MAG: hypothetical protein IKK24_03870 [Clostridia bacterium]|nr:hypothetical protein [Clostridia bacterium]